MSGFPYHQPQVLLPNGSCYLYFNTSDPLPEVTNTIDTVADRKRKLRDVTCLSSEQSEGTEVHYRKESLLMDPRKGKVRKQKKATEETKLSSEPPSGYIHVRARRGLATDSHSLAERVRREKISQRMKLLQDLVPGCDRVTGKAGLLDEIINYVQTLQHQVEFLSMKLALVNPALHGLDEGLRANEEQQQQNPWSMSVPSVLQTSPIQQATPNVATGSHSMMDYHSQLLLQGQVSMENGTYIIQVADQSEEPPSEQVLNDIIFSELN